MCGLFSTPEMPEPTPIPIEEEETELVGSDVERRRAAARRGFESTWLGKSRTGLPGGGLNTGGGESPAMRQRPQTVLRKTMGE